MSLDVKFSGDDKLIANFRGMGPAIERAGADSIKRSTMKVLRKAKEKVSGDVLKNRTGTLRRGINARFVGSAGFIVGIVGIKLRYAAAHEFGCHKTVTVKQHLRRSRTQMNRRQMTGKGKRASEIGPREAGGIVHAHTMKMNLPEKSYLRSSLRELRSDIVADMRASVAKAVKP